MIDGDKRDSIDEVIEPENISSDEMVTKPFRPSDIRLTTPPMNLGDLIDMIEAGWINFGTDYQRNGDLWNDVKQSRLIESILLGLRLPAFYFEEVSKRQWNIIDGLQRCCAIRNYCCSGTLRLVGLEFLGDRFNGVPYSSFPFDVRRDFRMLPITVHILGKGTPDEVKYVLFKRLNTGGVPLTPQEIRTAMFQGKVVGVLNRLARSAEFLAATEGKISDRRQEDKDFVSRFIAFYVFSAEDFKPDLESFITRAMVKLRDDYSDADINRMCERFAAAMKLAEGIFGVDAFRKRRLSDKDTMPRRPLNKAYFEVLSSAFARLSQEESQKLLAHKDMFVQMVLSQMDDESVWNSFSGGTGRRESVLRRHECIRDAIERALAYDQQASVG